MNWFLDNINAIYVLLGIVALAFLVAGWATRRVKFFLLAGIPIALIVLFWLLTQLLVSDSQQIERNVQAMAAAVVKRDSAALMQHVSEEFRYEGVNKAQLDAVMKKTLELHDV